MFVYYCIIRGQYGVLHEGIVFSWYFRTQSGGAAMHTESLHRRGVWGLWHTVTTVAQLVNTGMIGEDRSSYGWFTLFGDHFQYDFLGNIYIYILYYIHNTSTNITLQPTQFLYVAACCSVWKHAIWYPSLDLGRLIGFPFPLQGVRWCFRSAYGFDLFGMKIAELNLHNVFLSWHGVPQFVAKIRS